MTGVQTCALPICLKADPATSGATLVAITGYGQQQDRDAALAAGFAHHLVKPVNVDVLLRVLDGVRGNESAGQSETLADVVPAQAGT